jgi:hypothetical protein
LLEGGGVFGQVKGVFVAAAEEELDLNFARCDFAGGGLGGGFRHD